MSEGSVTQWFRELEQGSPEAAQRLWDRYSRKLIELARRKLGNATRIADAEDIANTVFECICRAAAEGRFSKLQNRDELWWLLVMVTKQKALDQMRSEGRQKRGGGLVVGETDAARHSGYFSLDQLLGTDPTPEFLVMMDEEQRRLLALLTDDQLRTIAKRRIQGFSCEEIARQLDVSPRTVIRKLNLVRLRWQYELQREHD